MCLVALLATVIPTMQAVRVDPVEALREHYRMLKMRWESRFLRGPLR